MEETSQYTRRLQAITEKRKVQVEIDKKRRELEEERLNLQQLKRKSLRDQWLMDPSSPPAKESDGSSPLGKSQAYIEELQNQLASLQSQITQLETHASESAGLKKVPPQAMEAAAEKQPVPDTSASCTANTSLDLQNEKGNGDAGTTKHMKTLQENGGLNHGNGQITNPVKLDADTSSEAVELPNNPTIQGQALGKMGLDSLGGQADTMHLTAGQHTIMGNQGDHIDEVENGHGSGENKENLIEEHKQLVPKQPSQQIRQEGLEIKNITATALASTHKVDTDDKDAPVENTRSQEMSEPQTNNEYVTLMPKEEMSVMAIQPGIEAVIRAERVMITEDGEEVLVKSLEGYVPRSDYNTMNIGTVHATSETLNSLKEDVHEQAFQSTHQQNPMDSLRGHIPTIQSSIQEEITHLKVSIQEPVSNLQVSAQEQILSLQASMQEPINNLQAEIQQQMPNLQTSVQKPISDLQTSANEHIHSLHVSIQEPITSLQSSLQGQIPSLQASDQEQMPSLESSFQTPFSDIQASIQKQTSNLQASFEEPILNIQTSVQGQIPSLQGSIQETISDLQASVLQPISDLQAFTQEQIPKLQVSIHEPISNLQETIYGNIPNLEESIKKPVSGIQTSIQEQIPRMQACIQEPISILQESLQGQIPILQSSIQGQMPSVEASIHKTFPDLQASIQKQTSNLQESFEESMSNVQPSFQGQIPSLRESIQEHISDLQNSVQGQILNLHESTEETISNLQASTEVQIPSFQTPVQESISKLQGSIQGQTPILMEANLTQKAKGDSGHTITTTPRALNLMSPEHLPLLQEINLSEATSPTPLNNLQQSSKLNAELTKPLINKSQEDPMYTATSSNRAQANPHRSTANGADGIAAERPKQKTCQCCSVM